MLIAAGLFRCGLRGFEIVRGLRARPLRWCYLRAWARSLRDRDGRRRPSLHLGWASPALDGRKRPSPHGLCRWGLGFAAQYAGALCLVLEMADSVRLQLFRRRWPGASFEKFPGAR